MPVEVRTLADWEADGVAGMLSVVIPAHNEEGRIEATVRDLMPPSRRPASRTRSWSSTTTAAIGPREISSTCSRRSLSFAT